VIEPQFPFWDRNNCKDGKSLPDGFSYRSDTNEEWISKEQMTEILKNHDSPPLDK